MSVEIDPGEVCPTGWATVDATVAHAERIFYVLPSSLVDAFHDTHIGGGFAEFLVSDAFVAAVFPTRRPTASRVYVWSPSCGVRHQWVNENMHARFLTLIATNGRP